MTRSSTVSAGKRGPMPAPLKGKLRHIHIEPLDDGTFQSETRHAPPKSDKKSDMPMFDYEALTQKRSHASPEEAGSFVTQMLGGKQPKKAGPKKGKEGSAQEEASESKAEAKAEGDE